MKKRRTKPRRGHETRRRKPCRFCQNPSLEIDYKNIELLRQFVSERGKIKARRVTGTCAKHQRKLAIAIKRARFLGLLPYHVYVYR